MEKPRYKIDITPMKRGHQMTIGCQTFCYGDSQAEMEDMRIDLIEYLENPKGVRERYPNPSGGLSAIEEDFESDTPGPEKKREARGYEHNGCGNTKTT